MQALKLYRLDNQRYPTTEQGLQSLLVKPAATPIPLNWKQGGYIERLPKDPWGGPYQYLNPGVQGKSTFSATAPMARPAARATTLISAPGISSCERCDTLGREAGASR